MADPLERGTVALGANALRTPLTGIGQYTLNLARELRRGLAQAPWLFYGSEWSREIRTPPPAGNPPPLAGVKRAVPFGFEIGRFLDQRRFDAGLPGKDIALYHEPNFLAYRFDGPTVVTVHDLSWIRFPETHPADRVRIMSRALPKVLARTSCVITDSEYVRGEVIAHYGLAPDRVHAVPLGVSPSFRPLDGPSCAAALRSHDLQPGRYVLTVGTLEPRKNLDRVLRAHRMLRDDLRSSYPLVVVGMAGWGDSPRADPDVRFLGYVAQEALPALYSGARAFVYASLYEGFGLPPLEAMASGTPVVVSRTSALPELIGDAGSLAEPLDEADLSARLQDLLEDDDLHSRRSALGIERARHFSWERCAARTLDVYRKALGG